MLCYIKCFCYLCNMKTSQFIKILRANGCYIKRHGANHDWWYSPKTKACYPIPRHGSHELDNRIIREATKVLDLKY